MCPSEAICLSADYCFSDLALYKSNKAYWSSTKRTSSSSHWKLTCSRHDVAEKLLNVALNTIILTPYTVLQHDFHIRWCSKRLTVTRRVSLVELELLTFENLLNSIPVLSAVRVFQSAVFCVMFCRTLFLLFLLVILLSVFNLFTTSVESRSWRGVLDTTFCDIVCHWLATGRRFSPCMPVSSTKKLTATIYLKYYWKWC
jgi:hypothetical protein